MKSLEKNKKNPKKVSEISEIIMPPEDSSPPNPKVEENNPPKKPAFFMPSNIAAKYFTNLDQCCCADVPCLSIIKEYCESSSLHGWKYITEDGRSWIERVLWFILCLCGFILTIYFIVPIWVKWSSQPTLTTLDSTNHPVWEIDFPAVTICSPNKVVQQKLETLAQKSPWKDAVESSSFETLQKLFEFVVKFKDPEVKDTFEDIKPMTKWITPNDMSDALFEVMPNCTEFIQKCWWQGNIEECGSIFELRKTDEGFCCSFNALRQSETIDLSSITNQHANADGSEGTLANTLKSFQEEFFDETNENIISMFDLLLNVESNGNSENNDLRNQSTTRITNVRRINSANRHRGLSLLLNISSDDYFITTDDFIGLKLLVHDPSAYPELQSKALAIGSGQEFFITTLASHTYASSRIRDFDVQARNCLFEDERDEPNSQVTMFKHYSEENCLLECRAKHLMDKCGCLPYYYPRLDILLDFDQVLHEIKHWFGISNNISTCDWDGLHCLANASDLLDSVRPMDSSTFAQHSSSGAECRCPPACSKTKYASTSSSAKFPNKASRFITQANQDELSMVHVYFGDLKMVRYITDELFSWQDILAAFGGLVGLCTGFSFLSAAEIVYFFTLRCSLPLCRKKRRRLHPGDTDNLVMIKVED